MDIELELKGGKGVSLEENVKGYRGLDLYIVDRDRIEKNSTRLGLESQLIYTTHTKSEEGRRLVEGMMTNASGRIFTTAEYLESLESGYNKALPNPALVVQTKRDGQIRAYAELTKELYGASGKNTLFRYHPTSARTRLLRWAPVATVGALSAVSHYTAPSVGPVAYAFALCAELAGMLAVSHFGAKYTTPFVMDGKSMLIDIQKQRLACVQYERQAKSLNDALEREGRTMSLQTFERTTRHKNKAEVKLHDGNMAYNAMMTYLPAIHGFISGCDGLHLSYKGSGATFGDARTVMMDLIPDKKR